MPDARLRGGGGGRVAKIKNRCGDEEAHLFVMNDRLSVSPRPAFANVTAASGRGRVSHLAHGLLFVICCDGDEQSDGSTKRLFNFPFFWTLLIPGEFWIRLRKLAFFWLQTQIHLFF